MIRISSCIGPLGRSLCSRKLILEVFLPPSNRGEQIAANDTEECSQDLPDGHDDGDPRQNKLDELIGLVQVVLAGDVVLDFLFILWISLRGQV